GDAPVGGGEGDQVHAFQFVPQVAPGVAGGVLGDPDQQQGQPAQLDVGADAVLAVVEYRPEPQRALHVLPPAFDGDELLIGGGQVVRGQGLVRGAQQPLAVQVLFAADGAAVNAQQPGLGAAQQPAQSGLVLQRSGQLVPPALGPLVRVGDQSFQVRHEPLAHGGVALGGLGVAADDEPLGRGPVVLAGHPDLLDPQVPGDRVVAALPGQRRGGLAVGVAELLGVDVVPAAPGQVGAVGRRGEPAVGHPDQPPQVPAVPVVLDPADDLPVGRGAWEGPAAPRDA